MTATVHGHEPVLPALLGTRPPAPSQDILAHFRSCSACDVTDAVGRLYSMDAGMRPLYSPMPRAVGVALTVKAVPGDNLAIHAALGMVGPDDVLVVDWRGHTQSCGSGVLSLVDPIRRGLAGVIIDGAWRDVEDIAALQLPLFGRGIAPYSPPKNQLGEVNVPIACGGVVVQPGDIIVADDGGIAVVPAAHTELVAGKVEPTVVRTSLEQYPLTELRQASEQRREALEQRFVPSGDPTDESGR